MSDNTNKIFAYKELTNHKLLELYKQRGFDHAVSVARQMLKSQSHKSDQDFTCNTHGELCETVLEMGILEFFANTGLDESEGWFYKKGLILKDPKDKDEDFLTELDLTLFTPECIYLFECKSYNQDKKLVDSCTIATNSGKKCDVRKQLGLHFDVLSRNFEAFRLRASGNNMPYKLTLFDFSHGATIDSRAPMSRKMYPCVTINTVEVFLQQCLGMPISWDMNAVRKAADIIAAQSDSLREKHLNYVKSLHNN